MMSNSWISIASTWAFPMCVLFLRRLILQTEYDATVTLPSAEFQRICRDLVNLSESVTIEVTKGSIKFSCQGDIGNGQVTLKPYDDPENEANNVSIELSQGV